MKRIGLFLTLICLAITAMAQTDTPTPRGFERPRQMMNEEQRQKFHEQMEERRKRDEERRKFRMEHVEKANKSFAEAKEGKDIKVSNDFITLGQKVFALTEQKEYDQFLSTLNKLSLANGFDLRVKECRSTPGPDDTSRLYITGKDLEQDFNIFAYLNVENSCMGAWQVYLLHSVWHGLPQYGHFNYANRTFLFSKDDFKKIHPQKEEYSDIATRLANFDVTPEVVKYKDKYYVSCWYWSEWGGLFKELFEITIDGKNATDIFPASRKVEFPYDCGIWF